MPLSQGAQEEPRAASKLPGRLQGGMPTPQEAFSGAASVTAHPGGRPPLPQAPGSWWRQAVPWTSAPCNSLKRTVCPCTAQILPPGHQGKRGCQRTPQQRSPARRTKSPGPGGGSGRPAGHHRMPGWKGRLDTAQAGGQRPGSKASAEAAVGGDPACDLCLQLSLAGLGLTEARGPPRPGRTLPATDKEWYCLRRGISAWALPPHYTRGTPRMDSGSRRGPARAALSSLVPLSPL